MEQIEGYKRAAYHAVSLQLSQSILIIDLPWQHSNKGALSSATRVTAYQQQTEWCTD